MPLSRWRTTPTTSRLHSMEVPLQAAWGKTGKASSGWCPRLPLPQIRQMYQNDVSCLISSTLACISSQSNRPSPSRSAFPINRRIKAVVLIPTFEVSTEKARGVLPAAYSRNDCVYNIQRAGLLPLALSAPSVDVRCHTLRIGMPLALQLSCFKYGFSPSARPNRVAGHEPCSLHRC